MWFAAVAFALALGAATPAIGAPADWTEEEFFQVLMEVTSIEETCGTSLKLDDWMIVSLDDIAKERFGDMMTAEYARKFNGTYRAVTLATERPATFCFNMDQRYGLRGTVLPGLVTRR